MDHCKIYSDANIPFVQLRHLYRQWVPLYLEWEELQALLGTLREERSRVAIAPDTPEVFLKRIEPYFRQAEERRIRLLCALLGKIQTPCDIDPFPGVSAFLGAMGQLTDIFNPPVTWAQVQEAVALLPAGMAPKARAKELASLDQRLAETQSQLAETTPHGRYEWRSGKISKDMWLELVRFWTALQGRVNGPVAPNGIVLALSESDEQWAHKQLGLSDYINKRGLRPHPGD